MLRADRLKDMAVYVIARVESRPAFEALLLNSGCRDLEVGCAPWGGDYRPKTFAKVCHDGGALHVCMRSYEKDIRTAVREHEGKIHTDSCMEFFFSPCPDEGCEYFNMEMNPLGYLKFNYGSGRGGRIKTVEDTSMYAVLATQSEDGDGAYWQLVYSIPFDLIRSFAPSFEGKKGERIRGNFYKCGELAPCPHLLAWNPIDNRAYPNPDFHRPEFFGEMVLG